MINARRFLARVKRWWQLHGLWARQELSTLIKAIGIFALGLAILNTAFFAYDTTRGCQIGILSTEIARGNLCEELEAEGYRFFYRGPDVIASPGKPEPELLIRDQQIVEVTPLTTITSDTWITYVPSPNSRHHLSLAMEEYSDIIAALQSGVPIERVPLRPEAQLIISGG